MKSTSKAKTTVEATPGEKKASTKVQRRSQHARANKLLRELDKLIADANLTMLPIPDGVLKATKAQAARKRRALAGKLRCYETFSGDPNYYLYDLDQASGTATPAGSQTTKPDCPACP